MLEDSFKLNHNGGKSKLYHFFKEVIFPYMNQSYTPNPISIVISILLRSKSKVSYRRFGLWIKYMKASKHVFTQVDLKKLRFVHLKTFKQESSFKLIECETLGFH